MPSIFCFRKASLLAVLLAAASAAAAAPQTEPAQEAEVLDEEDQPAITIRKPEVNAEITERRQGGMVEEVKVRSGPSTYYLYPQGKNGVPGTLQSTEVRPALWKVHEFDLGGDSRKEAKGEDVPEPLNAPALPPPTPN